MFKITRDTADLNCQVCHTRGNIYNVSLSDGRFGVELHLCSNCCSVLSRLTEEPDKRMYGIRMISIDELDK